MPRVVDLEIPVDGAIRRIEEAAGAVATPETPIAGVADTAHRRDIEGNSFRVIEHDQTAG